MFKKSVFNKKFTASELSRFFTLNGNLWGVTIVECEAVKIVVQKKTGGYLIRENRNNRMIRIFTHNYQQAENLIRQFFARYPKLCRTMRCRVYDNETDVHYLNLIQFAAKQNLLPHIRPPLERPFFFPGSIKSDFLILPLQFTNSIRKHETIFNRQILAVFVRCFLPSIIR